MTPILLLAALAVAALCWLAADSAADWLAHLDRDTDEGPLGL